MPDAKGKEVKSKRRIVFKVLIGVTAFSLLCKLFSQFRTERVVSFYTVCLLLGLASCFFVIFADKKSN